MIFLFLGILLHGDLRRYVDAISDAAGGAAGVLLQFPFYAGIMGMMVGHPEGGQSLAHVLSMAIVSVANDVTFPMFTFLGELGYLPRAAFNMDHYFSRSGSCGKQALTMCMG